MTVSILDDARHGFYTTFARITWVEERWVGLDHGIEAHHATDANPRLITAYPLVFGHGVHQAALRGLTLDGGIAQQATRMNGCRGGAVYFARSMSVEIEDVIEQDYSGDGLSFQMCRDMVIRRSSFDRNSGNGLHPGAGSTGTLLESCGGNGNEGSGFFFCVRANHMTVRECGFHDNRTAGVSIGTRDCHNLIERCRMTANEGSGIVVREMPRPTEVHSCRVHGCTLERNARSEGAGEIDIRNAAHDIIVEA